MPAEAMRVFWRSRVLLEVIIGILEPESACEGREVCKGCENVCKVRESARKGHKSACRGSYSACISRESVTKALRLLQKRESVCSDPSCDVNKIEKRKHKRSYIEAYDRNETKTF